MPATPEPTAYETLGVPRTSTPDEIKKRYRELARQLHPDVNQDNPAASRQFSSITQAYKTVSDPDSRKVYDAELILREQKVKQAESRQAAANSTFTPRTAPGATTSGRTVSPTSTGADSARLTGEARSAFLRDRPVEARSLAEQAIRLNRRNADAWEVLGDVFRRQGRSEDAVNAYSMSLQINPRNPSVMQRLERMAKAAGPGASGSAGSSSPRSGTAGSASGNIPYRGATANYASPSSAGYRTGAQGRVTRLQDPDKQPLRRLLTWFMGAGSIFMLVLYAALTPGVAPLSSVPLLSWVSHWNGGITTILALTGVIMGATMTISGTIRRIDDELILSGVSGRTGTFLPLGLLLIVLSVFNFYLAAAVYAIVTALQESFTPSMVRVFGTVFGITVLLSVTYVPDHLQVFLFGGNVVFITFVIGWLLGDFFRPDIG